jgi:hypothetical protein
MITHVSRDSYEPGLHYRLKGYESGLAAARTLKSLYLLIHFPFVHVNVSLQLPQRRPAATARATASSYTARATASSYTARATASSYTARATASSYTARATANRHTARATASSYSQSDN